jgi:NLR family CARD domain-containing protein 3
MEVMVRIAEKRYKSSTVSFSEAVEIMIRDNLLPIYTKYTVAQKWREEKYWNEKCDDVLKAYKFILENVYSRYSVKKVKPSQKKFMCLEEFFDIFKHSNLIDENFVERDVLLAFNLAMMTSVDELSNDRIFQMTFVEFLEAFCRCADKLSLPKIAALPNVPVSMNRLPAPSETNIVS